MHDFEFVRLRYDSGDWNVDPRMPSNLLDSLVQYTSIDVAPEERVVALRSPDVLECPFVYLAGRRLVKFDRDERRHLKMLVENGGFVFVDDCNHDIDGLFARSFEHEIAEVFGPRSFVDLPKRHALYRSFFRFDDGPPTTSYELNGWGDDLVHESLRALEVGGRVGLLYSNKDYGCEWDYDWRNKRWLAEDNTKFGVNVVVYSLTS